MNLLKEIIKLDNYKKYPLQNGMLYIDDNNKKWFKLDSKTAIAFEKSDGKRFRDFYKDLNPQSRLRRKRILALASMLFAENKETEIENVNKSAFFVITRKCNLKCIQCYIANDKVSGEVELNVDEIENVFKKLKEYNFTSLVISGGEPLLKDEIEYILKLANQYFEHVSINTNATLLTPRLCKLIYEYKISVMVSLEGMSEELNDQIRGKGTKKRILAGIKLLKEHLVTDITLAMTLTNININDNLNLYRYCLENNIKCYFSVFFESGRGRCNSELLSVDPLVLANNFEKMMEFENKVLDELGVIVEEDTINPLLRGCKSKCGAALSMLNIMPNGDVYPCPNMIEKEHLLGNIKNSSVEELMTSEAAKVYQARDLYTVQECSDCEVRLLCGGGCMANSYIDTGSIYTKDPLCLFYKEVFSKAL